MPLVIDIDIVYNKHKSSLDDIAELGE